MKRKPTEWERIFVYTSNRGLIFRIYKSTHTKRKKMTQMTHFKYRARI